MTVRLFYLYLGHQGSGNQCEGPGCHWVTCQHCDVLFVHPRISVFLWKVCLSWRCQQWVLRNHELLRDSFGLWPSNCPWMVETLWNLECFQNGCLKTCFFWDFVATLNRTQATLENSSMFPVTVLMDLVWLSLRFILRYSCLVNTVFAGTWWLSSWR